MHGKCGHTIHSHLNDESLVQYFPSDSPRTLHKKNQEKFVETVIINHLKKYIDEYNCFIGPLDEQIKLYACQVHSDFQILKNSEIKVKLQV